ncbi:SDR family oxidoreductase [Candidatus Woesearchaeota archaeon]|nr:SDR family oxidoreductase [Candidatus Woesearchaeota archaeon]
MLNKSVLITGSTNGLGRELALSFADQNYTVLIHGRNPDKLNELFCEIKSRGVECFPYVCDLLKRESLAGLVEIAVANNVGVLVNNAGVYLNKPLSETTSSELDEIMQVNFYVPFFLTRGLLSHFGRNGSGLIVNINSLAGKQGSQNETAYSASKHALRGFSDSLRYEVIRKGVRIIDLYFGAMATQMTKGRKDPSECIQPKEAAKVITSLCENYETLSINEVNIGRRIYTS